MHYLGIYHHIPGTEAALLPGRRGLLRPGTDCGLRVLSNAGWDNDRSWCRNRLRGRCRMLRFRFRFRLRLRHRLQLKVRFHSLRERLPSDLLPLFLLVILENRRKYENQYRYDNTTNIGKLPDKCNAATFAAVLSTDRHASDYPHFFYIPKPVCIAALFPCPAAC